ncbi:MAG: YhjD/YihY/BrkB family envelope integrity protein [Thermomicrobium sp.]
MRVPRYARTIERVARASCLWRAYQSFAQRDGALYAASIAYAAVLSLGPFLLALATLGGLLLRDYVAPAVIIDWVTTQLPQTAALAPLLTSMLERQAEAASGLLALASVLLSLWAASLLGSTLRHTLRAVAAPALPRAPLRERLIGLSATLVALLAATAWLGILGIVGGLLVQLPFVWRSVIGLAVSWLVFAALYTFLLPGPRLPYPAIAWSSLFAAVAWELTKAILAFLTHSFGQTSEVYSLLGALLALLVAAHVAAMITLYGAILAVILAEERFHRAEHST